MYKCKFCGKKLARQGDICTNCYNDLLRKNRQKRDNKELFKFKATYNFKYEFLKNLEYNILLILLVLMLIFQTIEKFSFKNIFSMILVFTMIFTYEYLKKKRIESREIMLYKTRLVYTRKLHFKNRLEVDYDKIADIRFDEFHAKNKTPFFTPWRRKVNKKYDMNTLYFSYFENKNILGIGFSIGPVKDFEEKIMPKMLEIMKFEKKDLNTEE